MYYHITVEKPHFCTITNIHSIHHSGILQPSIHIFPSYYLTALQSPSIRQKILQLPLLRLQIRVATNVLLLNVDVWHGGLAVELLEGGLDGGSVIYC